MSEYALLFRGDGESGSPDEMQALMQKWGAWIKELQAQGAIRELGRPLERGGKVIRGAAKIVTDGPYAETKDIVGGFLIVHADSLDEAMKLANGCPGLDVGDMVEVRPVMEMNLP